jgi:hypothetical protein
MSIIGMKKFKFLRRGEDGTISGLARQDLGRRQQLDMEKDFHL